MRKYGWAGLFGLAHFKLNVACIDKYYLPANDDIKIDRAMKSVFNKITDFVFCQALFPKKSVRIPNVINLKAEDIYS